MIFTFDLGGSTCSLGVLPVVSSDVSQAFWAMEPKHKGKSAENMVRKLRSSRDRG